MPQASWGLGAGGAAHTALLHQNPPVGLGVSSRPSSFLYLVMPVAKGAAAVWPGSASVALARRQHLGTLVLFLVCFPAQQVRGWLGHGWLCGAPLAHCSVLGYKGQSWSHTAVDQSEMAGFTRHRGVSRLPSHGGRAFSSPCPYYFPAVYPMNGNRKCLFLRSCACYGSDSFTNPFWQGSSSCCNFYLGPKGTASYLDGFKLSCVSIFSALRF